MAALRGALTEYVGVLRQLGTPSDAAKVEKQLAEVRAGTL
jgi:hypothetical protein